MSGSILSSQEIFQSLVIEPGFVIRDADLGFTGHLNNLTLRRVNRGTSQLADQSPDWHAPNLDTFADHEIIVQHSVIDTSGNPSEDIGIVFAAMQTLARLAAGRTWIERRHYDKIDFQAGKALFSARSPACLSGMGV